MRGDGGRELRPGPPVPQVPRPRPSDPPSQLAGEAAVAVRVHHVEQGPRPGAGGDHGGVGECERLHDAHGQPGAALRGRRQVGDGAVSENAWKCDCGAGMGK